MPILVQARGRAGSRTFADCPEIWSCGTWFNPVSGVNPEPSVAMLDEVATDCRAAWQALFETTATARLAGNVWLEEARAYWYPAFYGTTGKLQPAAVIGYSEDAPAVQSNAPTQPLPLQASVVVSMVAAGRVKPKYGRIYLPPPAAGCGQDALLDGATTGSFLSQAKTLFSALDVAVGSGMDSDHELVILSRSGASGGAVRLAPVRELRVGRALDTQRRRRNALDEQYQLVAYP